MVLASIYDTCSPRDEILAGEMSLDLFAAKLRLVVEGSAPLVYRDATTFFANTFPTEGLKTLIAEVFGRLSASTQGSPIIRLETSFGGGKTHDEIALWHIAKNGRAIEGLEHFVDLNLIPDHAIQVSAIACQDLSPADGLYHHETGITTYTLWGEIAHQLGGAEAYELIKGADRQRVSPGTVVLERLIGNYPTLIILDEIALHLRTAKATIVGNSDLASQVVAFLFSVMDLAAACNNLVFVYTLASTSDSFGEETTEIREAMQTSARQERILKPSTDVEIYNIVKQRVFNSVDAKAAEATAREYHNIYKASRINLPDGCKDTSYAQAIKDSYPFHPELFNLLTKKIASIPNFQRTRGALRLFAILVRYLWHAHRNWMPLIHAHHLPVGMDEELTSDLTSRLERSLMRVPIQADIFNPDGCEAHAQVQDQEWLAAGKPPFSTWIGRTIFLHSLTQGISSGIRRAELNLSLMTPGLEISFVDRAIERLETVAWYLDNDPITTLARFKEEPSINKIIAEEKEQVGRAEAKEDLRSRRDTIFAEKFFKLVSAPESAADVDDQPEPAVLCLIDFNEATVTSTTDGPPPLLEQIFNNTGEAGKFRTFRNRLMFLVANKHELERAIDNAREFRAIKNILRAQNRLDDLTENQQKQLRAKEGEMDLNVRVSLTNAYRHLFYPANDPVKAPKGLLHYGLPAQDASDVKGKKNQQEVILKALKDCQKIRSEDAPPYAPAYILQKAWPAGLDHWTTKALRDAFAKDLNLNLLLDAEVAKLRETIRVGLQQGQWDLKVGDRVFIKTDSVAFELPQTVEFSERMVLYRRGILEPPKPREIELQAHLLSSSEPEKPVRVRWKAQGALSITLYQDGLPLSGEFRPCDEYEGTITQTTSFKVKADYGNGERLEKEAKVAIASKGSDVSPIIELDFPQLPDKPPILEASGTPNAAFTMLQDQCVDYKVQKISMLEISVGQVIDYRKMTTALPLLGRFPIQIDQTATIQTGDQFVRLIYQGPAKGFQSYLAPTNALLGSPEVNAQVTLKLIFTFEKPVQYQGLEISSIMQALNRNPVERLNVVAQVGY